METSECFHGGFCFGLGGASPFAAAEILVDQFLVEDLLDFSNGDVVEEEEENAATDGKSVGSSTVSEFAAAATAPDSSNSCVSSTTAAGGNLSGDFCEPSDALAELEWLSNFVEDSFSSEDLRKLHLISGMKTSTETSVTSPSASRRRSAAAEEAEAPPLPTRFPVKARSKRPLAPSSCSWSSGVLSALDIASKKPTISTRSCLHCGSEKTPQWRAGPMGPKTLCNACGVRFKSGRLVPEYRPAASPSFSISEHSNSHRKVLELRRVKELGQLLPLQP